MKNKAIHPCKAWEKQSSESQIKTRDQIESDAQKLKIPPSEHEWNLVKAGKLSKGWDKL